MVIRQMARDLAIADRGHRLPDGPRARRPRPVVAQRPPDARASGPPRRSCAARSWPPATAGRPANDRPMRCATRCGRRSTAEPLADVDYVSVADGTTLAELDRVDGPALLSLAVRFGTTRLIDNEPLGDGPHRPPDAGHGCRSADPPRLPHLLRGDRRRLPVPAGLLPRHRPGARADRGPDRHPGGDPAAARPGLGRAGRPLPADAPDPAAGRGGGDGRGHDPVPGRRTSRASWSGR